MFASVKLTTYLKGRVLIPVILLVGLLVPTKAWDFFSNPLAKNSKETLEVKAKEQLHNFIGQDLYAGKAVTGLGLKKGEKVLLEDIKIPKLFCDKTNIKRTSSCHAIVHYEFENKNRLYTYKVVLSLKDVDKPGDVFKKALWQGFETQNPYELNKYQTFFKSLKAGRLKKGMPSLYVRLLLGRPQKIIPNGLKEIYLYSNKTVVLKQDHLFTWTNHTRLKHSLSQVN